MAPVPPFFRYPMVPTGDVYFRRQGPQQWTGLVLNTMVRQLSLAPNPYGAEPTLTITYERDGFRNPESLRDWEISIAGDSFTELGYLPYEELFTTRLGASLQVRVRNLGVSYTGPLTQLSYLRDYGLSPKTRDVFITFFEGNDLGALDWEYSSLERWRTTGEREYRQFQTQSSFTRALWQFFDTLNGKVRPADPINAYFTAPTGATPVTLVYTPPSRAQLEAH